MLSADSILVLQFSLRLKKSYGFEMHIMTLNVDPLSQDDCILERRLAELSESASGVWLFYRFTSVHICQLIPIFPTVDLVVFRNSVCSISFGDIGLFS